MADKFETVALGIVAGFGVVMLLILFSMIPAMVWYCIDDMTAELVGVPELGNLPFLYVWPLCFLLSCVFKGQATNKSD